MTEAEARKLQPQATSLGAAINEAAARATREPERRLRFLCDLEPGTRFRIEGVILGIVTAQRPDGVECWRRATTVSGPTVYARTMRVEVLEGTEGAKLAGRYFPRGR